MNSKVRTYDLKIIPCDAVSANSRCFSSGSLAEASHPTSQGCEGAFPLRGLVRLALRTFLDLPLGKRTRFRTLGVWPIGKAFEFLRPGSDSPLGIHTRHA